MKDNGLYSERIVVSKSLPVKLTSFVSYLFLDGGVLIYLRSNDLGADMKTALDNGVVLVTPETKIQVEGWNYFVIIADPVGNRIGFYGDK